MPVINDLSVDLSVEASARALRLDLREGGMEKTRELLDDHFAQTGQYHFAAT